MRELTVCEKLHEKRTKAKLLYNTYNYALHAVYLLLEASIDHVAQILLCQHLLNHLEPFFVLAQETLDKKVNAQWNTSAFFRKPSTWAPLSSIFAASSWPESSPA